MDTRPSFYKILMDLPPKLLLPKGFTDKYGENLSERVRLRNKSGTSWNVRLEKMREEGEETDAYYFTRGWTKFCNDVDLKTFEVLVFFYAENSTFDVTVYAVTALEKEPAGFRAAANPMCRFDLKQHNYHKFHVPKDFSDACGLKEKREVRLECRGGSSARVKVNSCNGRVDFGGGWSGFLKANNFAINKTYSLEFLPAKNVIRVGPDYLLY
ncbi:uncharacterized protein LOC130989585 [Salvia miltiorrhiza]|uniref:uncharacterized protein LOC130989585 n=1 Tax=Salvia miltiorrhiza TaxID=226208 RepID=UPI0025AD2C9D|nr:uncharacterized protein LOC130989585 [Salvia miltiorrhiza]